jgi:TfuA protein
MEKDRGSDAMTHEIVVFLGPSLPKSEASRILSAEYLPPARRGDLPFIAGKGVRIICLIDGVFFQESAVAHKEVLSAISQGIRVIGASSMGALRASELDTLGMEGVGEVYRLYKSGEIDSDDEVALIFDPEEYFALSVPLVNIRHLLKLAADKGIIRDQERLQIFSIARSLYFPQRTWETISSLACREMDPAVVGRFIGFADTGPDLKREDAVRALEYTKNVAERLGIRV